MARSGYGSSGIVYPLFWFAFRSSSRTHDHSACRQTKVPFGEYSSHLDFDVWCLFSQIRNTSRRVNQKEVVYIYLFVCYRAFYVILDHRFIIKIYLAMAAIQYYHLASSVINQICDYLDIGCLYIKHKRE